MGVRWLRFMRDMLRGMCPFLAPTKNNLNKSRTDAWFEEYDCWERQQRKIKRMVYKGILLGLSWALITKRKLKNKIETVIDSNNAM